MYVNTQLRYHSYVWLCLLVLRDCDDIHLSGNVQYVVYMYTPIKISAVPVHVMVVCVALS